MLLKLILEDILEVLPWEKKWKHRKKSDFQNQTASKWQC